jgi:copper chaperone CopZ
MPEVRLTVTGMTCGGCEREVRQSLERLAGVKVLSVDRTRNEARVSLEGPTTTDQLVAAVQAAGRFKASTT